MLGTFTSPDEGRYDNPSAMVGVLRFAEDHTFAWEQWYMCPGSEPIRTYDGEWEAIDESTVLFSYTTQNGSEAKYKLERPGCNEFELRGMNRGEWLTYTTPRWRGEMCMFQKTCYLEDGSELPCECVRGYCDEGTVWSKSDDTEQCESCPRPEPFVCDDDDEDQDEP
jgi:hypothetical protein